MVTGTRVFKTWVLWRNTHPVVEGMSSMRRDTGLPSRRARASPLFLEPLEDRRLLSGISPSAGSAVVARPGQGMAAVSAIVRTDTRPDAQQQPTLDRSSSGDSSAAVVPALGQSQNYFPAAARKLVDRSSLVSLAAPCPAAVGVEGSSGEADSSSNDPTPGDAKSAQGSADAGQAQITPQYGAGSGYAQRMDQTPRRPPDSGPTPRSCQPRPPTPATMRTRARRNNSNPRQARPRPGCCRLHPK
jgi:hypothetical protein